MSVVYVPHVPRKRVDNADGSKSWMDTVDLTPAAVYGSLQVVFQSPYISILPAPMVVEAKHTLRNFCDDDYVVAVGDPVAIAITSALAAENNMGRLKLLRWDRRTRQYIEFRVDIRGRKT